MVFESNHLACVRACMRACALYAGVRAAKRNVESKILAVTCLVVLVVLGVVEVQCGIYHIRLAYLSKNGCVSRCL